MGQERRSRGGRGVVVGAGAGAGAGAGRASEGGGSGCLSHTLTSGDFVPVTNGSEYIKEKKLKFLTFFVCERISLSYGCIDQP